LLVFVSSMIAGSSATRILSISRLLL
jgi:hypothetical protein